MKWLNWASEHRVSIKIWISALRFKIRFIFLLASSLILTPKPLIFVQVIDIPDWDLFKENGFIYVFNIIIGGRLVVLESFIDGESLGSVNVQYCFLFTPQGGEGGRRLPLDVLVDNINFF